MNMNDISDISIVDNIPALVALTVPGIIILYVRSRFLLGHLPAVSERLVAYIAVTLVYYAFLTFTFSFIGLLSQCTVEGLWHEATQFGWFNSTIVLAIPTVLGFLLGLDAQHGWTRGLLERLGVELIDPTPTAWDTWFFQRVRKNEGLWAVVTLKDGAMWFGYLGGESITSRETKERDIYIQEVYRFENGVWQETEKTKGVWIAHGEIQTIEFMSDEMSQKKT